MDGGRGDSHEGRMNICSRGRTKRGDNTVTNFIQTITLGILDQFQQSKWPLKALKKTFQMVPETSQSDQYSLSYQQINQ